MVKRECHWFTGNANFRWLYFNADGPEIGVASTKAFTAPLVDLYMLAVLLGDLRGVLKPEERKKLVSDLRFVPALVGKVLERDEEIRNIAKEFKFIKLITRVRDL